MLYRGGITFASDQSLTLASITDSIQGFRLFLHSVPRRILTVDLRSSTAEEREVLADEIGTVGVVFGLVLSFLHRGAGTGRW